MHAATCIECGQGCFTDWEPPNCYLCKTCRESPPPLSWPRNARVAHYKHVDIVEAAIEEHQKVLKFRHGFFQSGDDWRIK